jgi:hypothetical protein
VTVRKGASAHADWRAIVTAYAPNGVPYDDLACAVGDYAASEIGNLGPVMSGMIDEGKRWIEITIAFPKTDLSRDGDPAVWALSIVGRILSRFGLTASRVEVESA